MDAGFLDRLLAFDCFQVDREKIQWIEEEILQGPDWDISLAGKSFPPAEPICQWIKALVSYHSKKNVGHISLRPRKLFWHNFISRNCCQHWRESLFTSVNPSLSVGSLNHYAKRSGKPSPYFNSIKRSYINSRKSV